jgi:hypothetical protein
LNEKQIVKYIRNYRGLSIDSLSRNTGEDKKLLRGIISRHNLDSFVVDEYDEVIKDLTDNESGKYTIPELAEKHGINYVTLWRYVTAIGMKHLFRRSWSKNPANDKALINLLKTKTVMQVSRIARKRGLRPCSRQGLYDFCRYYGITPLTNKDVTQR